MQKKSKKYENHKSTSLSAKNFQSTKSSIGTKSTNKFKKYIKYKHVQKVCYAQFLFLKVQDVSKTDTSPKSKFQQKLNITKIETPPKLKSPQNRNVSKTEIVL